MWATHTPLVHCMAPPVFALRSETARDGVIARSGYVHSSQRRAQMGLKVKATRR